MSSGAQQRAALSIGEDRAGPAITRARPARAARERAVVARALLRALRRVV